MPKPRSVVVSTFAGSVVVKRLAPTDPDPSPETLEAIAAAWGGASSDGIRPTVRIIESMPSLRSAGLGSGGAAGSPAR